MKKLLPVLLIALCVFTSFHTLAQESMELKTTVPSEHIITVVCKENGSVTINGKTYSGTFAVKVKRLDSLTITVNPDKGYQLAQIQTDNPDGVSIARNEVVISEIYCENTITVSFCRKSEKTKKAESAVVERTDDESRQYLYDAYLGTGGSMNQLYLVFDDKYKARDYILLKVSEGENVRNSIQVCALPDQNGKTARRSMILSAAQLQKLNQKQQIESLAFENGDAFVSVDMEDLIGEKIQKLMTLILQGDEKILSDFLDRDWSKEETKKLTADELEYFRIEIRIVPVEREDSSIAYEGSVWLKWETQELNISGILTSMDICLNVDEWMQNDSFDNLTQFYTVGYQREDGSDYAELFSTFRRIPELLPEVQPDEAKLFTVSVSNEDSIVVEYDSAAALAAYRHSVLAAGYAGDGFCMIVDK